MKEKAEKKEKKLNKQKENKTSKKEKNINKKENIKSNKMVKTKEKKEKKRIVERMKKNWLLDGTKTCILVILLITAFIAISLGMKKLEIEPIDFSKEKLYTLTEGSKEKLKDIEKEVTIYFIEYREDDTTLDLAKQYKKVSDKIKVEAVKAADRPDLVQKYGLETGTMGIIIESGEKSKVIAPEELVSYDYATYEPVNVAEEKLTAAIQSIVTDVKPKVYFLNGYSNLTLEKGLSLFNVFLQNEINEVKSIDLLTTGKVPEDCDTLVISTPVRDFEENVTNAIIEYINSGKNILWFEAATAKKQDLPNVNKVLEVYGVKPFEVGIIRENDKDMMVADLPDIILPEVKETEVTKKISKNGGIILMNATKINTMEAEKLEENKITKTDLVVTSEKSYFRTNFMNTSNKRQEDEKEQSYVLGAMMEKVITEKNEETGEKEKKSKLIIYGDNFFISDVPLSQESRAPMVVERQNKDIALNSIAYLVDRPEDIVARKSTGTVKFEATKKEDIIIKTIIFSVPAIIIVAGLIVWIVRKRK